KFPSRCRQPCSRCCRRAHRSRRANHACAACARFPNFHDAGQRRGSPQMNPNCSEVVMKVIKMLFVLSFLTAPLLAQQQHADFVRVRENNAVVLVLGTGGECYGKVARRKDAELAVMLTSSNPD